jgi:site-specific DNA-methyltransferase (adenine-specific)
MPPPQNPLDVVLPGDCRTKLYELQPGSVDLVITSPPYANARKATYGGIDHRKYVAWFTEPERKKLDDTGTIAGGIMRVLKPDGSFILNIKECAVNGEISPYVADLVRALRAMGLRLTEEYIWFKMNPMPGYWPNRFRNEWEHLYHFTLSPKFRMYQKEVMEPIGNWVDVRLRNPGANDHARAESATGSGFGRNISHWKGKTKVYPTNVLHIPMETANTGHSAPFPVALPGWFIRLFTKAGDTVLDPFMGSGTTAVAAIYLDRHFIGIERNDGYRALANDRIAAATQRMKNEGEPTTMRAPVYQVSPHNGAGK